MVFLFWEKTGIAASKATNTSKIRFIRSVQVLVSSLQIYFLCTNKANRTWVIYEKFPARGLKGISSLCSDIPCPCREGPCKQIGVGCACFLYKPILHYRANLSPGFRRFAPTSPAACGGLCRKEEKAPSSKLVVLFLLFCGERGSKEVCPNIPRKP